MFDLGPSVRRVNLDSVDAVIPGKDGGVVVVATRGKSQYRISVPDSVLPELIARLRRPV
jgi:hypothetical protein